jgi:hypothetical protein
MTTVTMPYPACLGWLNRHQQAVIDTLTACLRRTVSHAPRIVPDGFCLTDDQPRRLAVKAKALGRRRLAETRDRDTDTIRSYFSRRKSRECFVPGGELAAAIGQSDPLTVQDALGSSGPDRAAPSSTWPPALRAQSLRC